MTSIDEMATLQGKRDVYERDIHALSKALANVEMCALALQVKHPNGADTDALLERIQHIADDLYAEASAHFMDGKGIIFPVAYYTTDEG